MKRLLSVIAVVLFASTAFAQNRYEGSFGKGLRIMTNDSTFYMKFGTRIQPRWDFIQNSGTDGFENRMVVKRARLKFDGFMLTPDLVYKIEYDVVGGYVRDAAIKYRFRPKWVIWFGQTKLPSNRERVISSGNLQLVDRSIFNANFTLDRDLGFQLHNSFMIGKVYIKDSWAISAGNGILNNRFSKGAEFTGKIEIQPFGKFTKKGDYIGADIFREKTYKLAIALGADYNMSAYKSRGQLGLDTGDEADLLLLAADLYMKYRGFSLLFETAWRDTPGRSAYVFDEEGNVVNSFYTGWGFNLQGGYVFKSMYELSFRVASVRPNVDFYDKRDDLTMGISKYIIGHKLKVQADLTYSTRVDVDPLGPNVSTEFVLGRLQMEVHF